MCKEPHASIKRKTKNSSFQSPPLLESLVCGMTLQSCIFSQSYVVFLLENDQLKLLRESALIFRKSCFNCAVKRDRGKVLTKIEIPALNLFRSQWPPVSLPISKFSCQFHACLAKKIPPPPHPLRKLENK